MNLYELEEIIRTDMLENKENKQMSNFLFYIIVLNIFGIMFVYSHPTRSIEHA